MVLHAPSTPKFTRMVLLVGVIFLAALYWTRALYDHTYTPSVAPQIPNQIIDFDRWNTPVAPEKETQPVEPKTEVAEVAGDAEEVTPKVAAPVTSVDPPKATPSAAKTAAGKPRARIGKVTATFGEPDPPYEDAIQSHQIHNEIHGYPHYILREHMIRGLWSKHGWIMTIIGEELAKPEDERLQWLMWHDRDTVLMNPQLPLEIFVPPEEFHGVHLLVTNDRNGLNNGVFMIRIGQWAFKMFASALSIREYLPDVELKYTEQSGMEEVIGRENWAKAVVEVPQRWFNGYVPSGDEQSDNKSLATSRPGSLLIHFASNRDGKRPERMALWHEVAKNHTCEWDRPANETGYPAEIKEFWERMAKGEDNAKIIKDIGRRGWSNGCN